MSEPESDSEPERGGVTKTGDSDFDDDRDCWAVGEDDSIGTMEEALPFVWNVYQDRRSD